MQASNDGLLEKWLGRLTVLVLLAGALLTAVIASGRLDPQPIGRLQASHPLSAQSVATGQRRATWLDEPVPAASHSLKLTAAYQSGEQDIGFGLLVGDPADYLGLAVSPLGYLTIWRGSADQAEQPVLPWQTWPHIGHGSESNEIWLNVAGNEVTVRLNGEKLWQGTVVGLGQRVGLWAESFGRGTVVDFQELRLYYE